MIIRLCAGLENAKVNDGRYADSYAGYKRCVAIMIDIKRLANVIRSKYEEFCKEYAERNEGYNNDDLLACMYIFMFMFN